MAPLVSVVVVNWNGERYIARCLESLLAQRYPEFEVVVVDNASADDSRRLIQERFPSVRLVCSETNRGFAGGVNLGRRAARGDLIATLNPDAHADPGWIAALVEAVADEPAVGMAASQMLFDGRPEVVNSRGIGLDVLGIAWDLGGGEATDRRAVPTEVFGPCAGAALYRRELFDDVGLFDEDFFLYLEDVDLAWRARLAGWGCAYVPSAVVYHQHSASAVEGSALKSFHLGRNKVWTIVKNAHGAQLLRYGLPILAYDLLAAGFALLVGRPAAMRGRLAALAGLAKMLRKRRAVKRRVTWHGFRPLLAGIETPLAVWRRYEHLAADRWTRDVTGARRNER